MADVRDEVLGKIENIVRDGLEDHFKGKVTLDPIEANRDQYDDEDRFLYILIVVDGSLDEFDEEWTVGWLTELREKLVDIGVEEFPVPLFMERTGVGRN